MLVYLYSNIKAARPIFHINAFQSSISDIIMRDLGNTMFESTFYLQFFASLTSNSLANWRSSHLKEMPKTDECNLNKTVQIPTACAVFCSYQHSTSKS